MFRKLDTMKDDWTYEEVLKNDIYQKKFDKTKNQCDFISDCDLTELNASVVGDNKKYEVSEIEQVYGKDEILSFNDKYLLFFMRKKKSCGILRITCYLPTASPGCGA